MFRKMWMKTANRLFRNKLLFIIAYLYQKIHQFFRGKKKMIFYSILIERG